MKKIPQLLFFVITLSAVIVDDVSANNAPVLEWTPFTRPGYANTVEFPENNEIGQVLGHLAVEDDDVGRAGMVQCVSTTPDFQLVMLDINEYKLLVTTSLDREKLSYYEVTIRCQDNGSPPMTSSLTVYAYVTDVNDNAPRFEQDGYSTSIMENSLPGDLIIEFKATDPDIGSNAGAKFFLVDDDMKQLFNLDPLTGRLRVKGRLDREIYSQINFRVKAVDYGTPPLSSEVEVHLLIEDANDNWPHLYTGDLSVTEGASEGTVVGTLQAFDMDLGANGEVEFLLRDPASADLPFSVTSQGDVVTTGDITLTAGEEYRLRVTVRDKGERPLSSHDYVIIRVTGGEDTS